MPPRIHVDLSLRAASQILLEPSRNCFPTNHPSSDVIVLRFHRVQRERSRDSSSRLDGRSLSVHSGGDTSPSTPCVAQERLLSAKSDSLFAMGEIAACSSFPSPPPVDPSSGHDAILRKRRMHAATILYSPIETLSLAMHHRGIDEPRIRCTSRSPVRRRRRRRCPLHRPTDIWFYRCSSTASRTRPAASPGANPARRPSRFRGKRERRRSFPRRREPRRPHRRGVISPANVGSRSRAASCI